MDRELEGETEYARMFVDLHNSTEANRDALLKIINKLKRDVEKIKDNTSAKNVEKIIETIQNFDKRLTRIEAVFRRIFDEFR